MSKPNHEILPVNLGIILDGNRRWAQSEGLAASEGHRQGFENLKKIAPLIFDRGIKTLTVFAFSTENWNRSKEEVNFLMGLILWIATHEVEELDRKGVRLRFLGSEDRVQPKIIKAIREAEKRTEANTTGTLAICFNYGGQTEIAEAMKLIVGKGIKSEKITPELISEHLYAADIPALDLIIRTSGEHRLSNFMLWRAAYAELYFTETHWPAFSEVDLDEALADYAGRIRRFGR